MHKRDQVAQKATAKDVKGNAGLHVLLQQLQTGLGSDSEEEPQSRRIPDPVDILTRVPVTVGNKVVNLSVSIREHVDHTLTTPHEPIDLVGEATKLHHKTEENDIPVLWYQVSYDHLIRTKMKFDDDVEVQVSYVDTQNTEEARDCIEFHRNKRQELPFPTDKKQRDGPDGWIIRAGENVVLKIFFVL